MNDTTTADSNDNNNNMAENIRAAVALLQSIGVRNLCWDDDDDDDNDNDHNTVFDPATMDRLLPACGPSSTMLPSDDDETMMTTMITNSKYALIFNLVGSLLMVLLIALMSGLFLGLLTLEILDLQIIGRVSTDADEKRYADSILPVVKDRHRLLVTLMMVDALAYESLPLFLDQLVPSWVAVLLSTTAILMFGEILPSGIFMGPNQLYLGHLFLPAAKFFLWILYPIAAPLGRLLDIITDTSAEGTAGAVLDEEYTRDELIALVQIQHERRQSLQQKMNITTRKQVAAAANGSNNYSTSSSNNNSGISSSAQKKSSHHQHSSNINNNTGRHYSPYQDDHRQPSSEQTIIEIPLGEEESAAVEQLHPPLHQREVDLVEGALTMKTQTAIDVYTPYRDVYAVPDNMILSKQSITEIYSHGYSRVPVYRYNDKNPDDTTAVLGFFITRQLMLIDWDDDRRLSTLPLQRPVCVSPKTNLVELFDIIQTNGLLLTFVCASPLLANKALKQNLPIPSTAGLMGICTMVDVMESILQDRIYDEGDIRERDRAVAILQQWASDILQNFLRKTARTLKRQRSITGGSSSGGGNHGTGSGSGPFYDHSNSSSCYHDDKDDSHHRNKNTNYNEETPLLYRASSSSQRDADYGGRGGRGDDDDGGASHDHHSCSEESNETQPLMKYSKQT